MPSVEDVVGPHLSAYSLTISDHSLFCLFRLTTNLSFSDNDRIASSSSWLVGKSLSSLLGSGTGPGVGVLEEADRDLLVRVLARAALGVLTISVAREEKNISSVNESSIVEWLERDCDWASKSAALPGPAPPVGVDWKRFVGGARSSTILLGGEVVRPEVGGESSAGGGRPCHESPSEKKFELGQGKRGIVHWRQHGH